MSEILDTLLLLALPASGKSEVRRYLAHLDPEACRRDFHMGPTVQLDDFPYVHMMRRIDEELVGFGGDRVFFHASDHALKDAREWGTLIHLLNEDYAEEVGGDRAGPAFPESDCAAELLLKRIDAAAGRVGVPPRLARLERATREALADRLESEARPMLEARQSRRASSLQGKTVVIEFARGGPDGASMPLPAPLGYQYSLGQLAPSILERSKILYIWVTPEESRRKNEQRADPDDPGSVLHHGVPLPVMMNDYGCDDMEWLEQSSDEPGTVSISAHGRTFRLPVARFDNRVDKTSFIRADPDSWDPNDIASIHKELEVALQKLGRRQGVPSTLYPFPQTRPGRG